MTDVVVIGAGLNGLIAASRLAARKFDTVICERQPVAGGAAVTGDLADGVKVPLLSHALGPLDRTSRRSDRATR
jgi:phytoene dehydrogenase-like protein